MHFKILDRRVLGAAVVALAVSASVSAATPELQIENMQSRC